MNILEENLFNNIYKGKKVLITGHTGFKGSWLAYWLDEMGAKVIGYSLEPFVEPNHYKLLNLNIISIIDNLSNLEKIEKTIEIYKPDIVFHLAAQALVSYSYKNPLETYETNVIGTIKLFEACRKYSVKAIVNITSDKAYENDETNKPFEEKDPLGGYDPYSASKGCADIITNSYRCSYFNVQKYKKEHNTLLASCRSGNVIGGGDWSEDRLIPDIIKAVIKKEKTVLRNPNAVRPWQHVLEPLSGYLSIGQKLLEEESDFSDAWNFGPPLEETLSVSEIFAFTQKIWPEIKYEINSKKTFHEAKLLRLDCSKANKKLHWSNVWNTNETITKTIKWYKNYHEKKKVSTKEDLENYIKDAKKKNLEWSINKGVK